jgi:TonB family protein
MAMFALHTIRFALSGFLRFAVMMLFLLAATPILRGQQQPDLDALASVMASAISNSSRGGFEEAKVLVIDFQDNSRNANKLGAKLADAFSDSLRKNARGFAVMDRADYLMSFAADKLDPQLYESPETMKCYADHLRATVVVDGNMDVLSDKVVLWVKALRTIDNEKIFDKRISLPLTPDMQPLISLSDADTEIPQAGQHGYSSPKCVYCPIATYSGAAKQAEIQGTVALTLIVDTTGVPNSVKVLRGLPCGLNQRTIDSVRQWRFSPASGPNGSPATVKINVEVTFHLY